MARYDEAERYILGGVEITTPDNTTYSVDCESLTHKLIDYELCHQVAEYNEQNAKLILTSNYLDVSAELPADFTAFTKGCVMRPWVKCESSEGSTKQYLGKFYVNNVVKNTASIETVITGYDRLYDHLSKSQDKLMIGVFDTVQDFLVKLFEALGIDTTEYNLDTRIASLPSGKYYVIDNVKTTLQYLMDAFNLVIYCDDNGIIQVTPWEAKTTQAVRVADDSQIYSLPVQKELRKTFAGVLIHFKTVSTPDAEVILSLDNIQAEVSEDKFYQEYTFSTYPVLGIAYVEVEDKTQTTFTNGITYDEIPGGVGVYFGDGSSKYTVRFYGGVVELKDSYVTQEIPLSGNTYAESLLEVDVPFIQSKAQATEMATRLSTLLSKGNIYLKADGRGNPDISLMGLCTIESNSVSGSVSAISLGQTFTYNGALSAVMTFIAPEGITASTGGALN